MYMFTGTDLAAGGFRVVSHLMPPLPYFEETKKIEIKDYQSGQVPHCNFYIVASLLFLVSVAVFN